ncbi:MAG: DegV family protein [Clostridia bacterium]|nr:DegV family protein [Clostridia bacterium]
MTNERFIIMADATCDLSEEMQKEYGVVIVPSHISLPDGRSIQSFLKWEEFTRDEFYTNLKNNPTGYTTAPPNIEEFTAAFEEYAKLGKDILILTISGGMSGTYNFAVQAQQAVSAKYPGVNIRVIDTMRFGPGHGLMLVYASMLRAEGKNFDEVANYIELNRNRFHQAGWLDDLSFVAKKGRITHAKAFFGTLAGVKPLGEFDYNGLTTVIGKVKGAKAAYAALIDYMKNTIENPEEQIIFIAQTNRYAQAEVYKKMIEDTFHPKAVYINDVFPMCGINIGPGLMAAYYFGKPISKDLSEERAILDKFINGGK